MAFKGPEQFFNGLLDVAIIWLNFYNRNILQSGFKSRILLFILLQIKGWNL